MVAVSGTRQNFKALQDLLKDQIHVFQQYSVFVRDALVVNDEVIDYVREKCGEEHEDMLSEMNRDNKIYLSRIKGMTAKSKTCLGLFDETNIMFTTKNIQKAQLQTMYERCLVRFFCFYNEKRELENRFKQAQRKWLKAQDFILASEAR